MVKNAESWSLKRFSNYPDTTSEISSMKRIIFTILIHVAYSNLSLALVSPSFIPSSIPSFRRVGRRDSWKQAFLGKDISHRVHS